MAEAVKPIVELIRQICMISGVKRVVPIALTAVMAAASLSAIDAAVAGSAHGSPVYADAPATPPTMTVSHHVCAIDRSGDEAADATGQGLVWVRPHPTSVVAVWISGLNRKKHCIARRTVGSAHIAKRLAHGVDHAHKVTGSYSCPMDDGTRVQLYLTYEQGRDELVDVPLAGCRFLNAPGRSSRRTTVTIDRSLRDLAPHYWTRYVGG